MEDKIQINGKTYVLEAAQPKMAAKKKGLEYCIIRTYSAGVWAGWIDTSSKNMCQEVYEARRLWRWWSEFTLSSLATDGMKKGKEKENKYDVPVKRVILKEIIEIIPCTEQAMQQIVNHPNYHEQNDKRK